MPPPMISESAHLQQRVDHAELVGHLGPAEDHDERPRRIGAQRQQHLDLALQQPAGGRRQELRRADDRGVGPVRRAEGVVHVQVLAVDQLLHERRVVGLFARIEAQVLEQLDAGRQLGQHLAHRLHRVLRIGLALRATEVGARRDRGAPLGQPLDGGQRGADAEVVDDSAVANRDVEVGAKQDSATGDVAEVLQNGDRSLFVGSADDLDEIDKSVRVAELVVVPAQHLHQVAR